MKNLVVTLVDIPGTLVGMAEALGKAGVNIEGICQVPIEGKGLVTNIS